MLKKIWATGSIPQPPAGPSTARRPQSSKKTAGPAAKAIAAAIAAGVPGLKYNKIGDHVCPMGMDTMLNQYVMFFFVIL